MFFCCRISSIYSGLNAAFEAVDVPGDISWWSVNCGTEMPTKWPEFEVSKIRSNGKQLFLFAQ